MVNQFLSFIQNAPSAFHATAALSGLRYSLEEYRQAVRDVRLQDVIRVAGTVNLHSSFFLKGVGA